MAHFGKIRSDNTSTLWGKIAAGSTGPNGPFKDQHGNVVSKDVDRHVTDYARPNDYLKKWNVAGNPIANEHRNPKLQAPPNVKEVQKSLRFQRAKDQALEIDSIEQRIAAITAIEQAEKRQLEKEIETAIDVDIAQDFRNWIAGRGKPEDYAKADLWPVDSEGRPVKHVPEWIDGQPLSRSPSVLRYLDSMVDENMGYETSLAKLRAKMAAFGPRNMTLPELWAFYKYYVRGMDPAEMAKDDFLRYHYESGPEWPVDQFARAQPTLSQTKAYQKYIATSDAGDASLQSRAVDDFYRRGPGQGQPRTALVKRVGVNADRAPPGAPPVSTVAAGASLIDSPAPATDVVPSPAASTAEEEPLVDDSVSATPLLDASAAAGNAPAQSVAATPASAQIDDVDEESLGSAIAAGKAALEKTAAASTPEEKREALKDVKKASATFEARKKRTPRTPAPSAGKRPGAMPKLTAAPEFKPAAGSPPRRRRGMTVAEIAAAQDVSQATSPIRKGATFDEASKHLESFESELRRFASLTRADTKEVRLATANALVNKFEKGVDAISLFDRAALTEQQKQIYDRNLALLHKMGENAHLQIAESETDAPVTEEDKRALALVKQIAATYDAKLARKTKPSAKQ